MKIVIASMVSSKWITKPAVVLLGSILEPYGHEMPSITLGSKNFASFVGMLNLGLNSQPVTVDVKQLYPSIDLALLRPTVH